MSDDSKDVHNLVVHVRSSRRFVRYLPFRLEDFKITVRAVGIECNKNLCLDVATRWNSAFLILEMAQKY